MAHRILIESLDDAEIGGAVIVTGDEAEHARKVKRLGAGDVVIVMNGRGLVARAEVTRAARELELRVTERETPAPTTPRVEVWSATPKGSRLDDMIDMLAQAGVASWRPLRTARGVVDPREQKLARQERIVREACKQSGRAWLMRIETSASLDEALAAREGEAVVMADAKGADALPTGGSDARLLIGPEGGWTDSELAAGRRAGALVCRFGPHAMRVETAAVVAAGTLLLFGRGG